MLASLAISVEAAPFAKVQLPRVDAFIPIYESALTFNDLITAILLLGQFSILRSRSMLLLACAYFFTGLMVVAHMLNFPGLFAEGGLLSGGPRTTAWLYMLWHASFPLLEGRRLPVAMRAELRSAQQSLSELTANMSRSWTRRLWSCA